jgi:K+/H+ antiporter YhaU regulatory subunit KhtT
LSTPAMLDRLKLDPQHSIARLRLPGHLAQRSLAQSELEQRHELTILLIGRADEMIISPSPA